MDKRLSRIYYSPRGYWKGIAAIKKLSSAAKVSEKSAQSWLRLQSVWQIYLPAPPRIPRPKFDVVTPNQVHQADLLYLPHDRIRGKTYKYALTVIDVASRYKEAEPIVSKESAVVAAAFSRIYRRGRLHWPKLLQVDPGREFMGACTTTLEKWQVSVRRGRPDVHRDQALVERWNRTLAERLFGHQYAVELTAGSVGSSREWVARLSAVVAAQNNEVTRLTGEKPAVAIRKKVVRSLPSAPAAAGRAVGMNEKKLSSGVGVRYLYAAGELEGGRRRATDPVWSLKVYRLEKSMTKPREPVLYYLAGTGAPARGFVREELLVVPVGTTGTVTHG